MHKNQVSVAYGVNIDTFANVITSITTEPICAILVLASAYTTNHITSKCFILYALVFLINFAVSFWRYIQRKQSIVDWSQHTVLLTGGSHGIGLCLLQRLIERQACVAVLDILDIPIDVPKSVKLYKCNLAELDQVHNTLDIISKDMGDITILINNAGTLSPRLLSEMSAADIDRVMNVNLLAPMHITRRLLPAMLDKAHAHLVFVASMLSFIPVPQLSTYTASKAGVALFYESVKLELKHRLKKDNVKTTAAFPSMVESGMFGGMEIDRVISPVVSPELIANNIFAHLDGGYSGDLYLPFCAKLGPLYMLLPEPGRRLAHWCAGSLDSMRLFAGYKPPNGKKGVECLG